MTLQRAEEAVQWESWPSDLQLQIAAALRRSHYDSAAVQAVFDLIAGSAAVVLEPLHRFSTLPVAGYDGLEAFDKFASCLAATGAKFAPADLLFCLRDSKADDFQTLLSRCASLLDDNSRPRYRFLPAGTYMVSDSVFGWIQTRWNSTTSLEDIGFAIGVLHAIDRPSLIRSLCEYLLFYQEISLGPFVYTKDPSGIRPVKSSIDIIRGLMDVSCETSDIILAEVDYIFSLVTCDDFEIPDGPEPSICFGPVQEILHQFVLRLLRRWKDERDFLSILIQKFVVCPTYVAVIDFILCSVVDHGIPIHTDGISSEGIHLRRQDAVTLIERGYGPALATALCHDSAIMKKLDRSASSLSDAFRYYIIRESFQSNSLSLETFRQNPFIRSTASLTLTSAVLSLRSFIAGFSSDSYLEVCRMLTARIIQWMDLLKIRQQILQVFDRQHLAEFLFSLDQLAAEPEFSLLPLPLRNTVLLKIEQIRSVVSLCSHVSFQLPGRTSSGPLMAGLIISSSLSLLTEHQTELIEFLAGGNEKFIAMLPSSFFRPILMAFAKIERDRLRDISDIWLDFFLQKLAVHPELPLGNDDIDYIVQMTSLIFDELPISDLCRTLHSSAQICTDAFMVLESLDDAALRHYAEFAPNSLSALIDSYLNVEYCWEWSEQVFGLKCARIVATLLSAVPKQFVQLISRLAAPINLSCLAAGLSYQLVRYPHQFSYIVETIWTGVLSLFGLYGHVNPPFPNIVDCLRCSDLDLSQLAAMLLVAGNRSYSHVGAIYQLNARPVQWLRQWVTFNSESEQLISTTLGLAVSQQNWLQQLRTNRCSVQYDSSLITFILHDALAAELVDILPELLIDRNDFARQLAGDMFALVSESSAVLPPLFWKLLKIAVSIVDDAVVARYLSERLNSQHSVNLESMLDVTKLVAERASNMLIEALIRVSCCRALESRIHCNALEILAICANAGANTDAIKIGIAHHAEFFFKTPIIFKYAFQVLVALQRSDPDPIPVRAAMSINFTSSSLLRLSYLSGCYNEALPNG